MASDLVRGDVCDYGRCHVGGMFTSNEPQQTRERERERERGIDADDMRPRLTTRTAPLSQPWLPWKTPTRICTCD